MLKFNLENRQKGQGTSQNLQRRLISRVVNLMGFSYSGTITCS
jgi:hypothetical protein